MLGVKIRGSESLRKISEPLFSDHSSAGSNVFDTWSELLHNTIAFSVVAVAYCQPLGTTDTLPEATKLRTTVNPQSPSGQTLHPIIVCVQGRSPTPPYHWCIPGPFNVGDHFGLVFYSVDSCCFNLPFSYSKIHLSCGGTIIGEKC